jgi:hypothetical protein
MGFLASTIHELRTPLHRLMTGPQLVAESLCKGEHMRPLELLPMVELCGHELQQILNDCLQRVTWHFRPDMATGVVPTAGMAGCYRDMILGAKYGTGHSRLDPTSTGAWRRRR